MNFIEAVRLAKEKKISVRRKTWTTGIVLSVYDNVKYRFDELSVGHVVAGAVVLTATDVLSEDWEIHNW